MSQSPPLTGLRVLEFAGLAPGPFAGMLLADYGATVLRVDRAHPSAYTSDPPPPTPDLLTRRKTSIAVNLKSPAGVALIKSLIPRIDIVIDPFRPGVLEKAGLDPVKVLLRVNPRLIIARMTGFRRDGKYKDMAGHDINYIAVSGLLSMLGRAHEKPFAPMNVMGDFAGEGWTDMGQVVEANMVDGSAFLGTMPRLGTKTKAWDRPRGENLLDGGCPYYDTYETGDGKYMAVGCLEPQFYVAFLRGLGVDPESLPGKREDRSTWPYQRDLFTKIFKSRTRSEWESIFDGTDACCTPVLTQQELEKDGFDQRPITEDLQLKDRESVLKAKDGSVKGYIPEKKAKRSCKGGWDGGEGGIMV
ncbi:Isopenicillin N epimerase component 2 [Taxawa tesnikishii (nom. ined.)]|nr:Isopenicillin N epimerase component 2 [Dothideales sp. JES 119]